MSVEPADPERVLRSLTGDYRCADLDCDATIRTNGEPMMRFAGGYGVRDLDLDVVSENVLGVTARDAVAPTRYAMTVIREDNEVVGFHISTNRARGLAFQRIN